MEKSKASKDLNAPTQDFCMRGPSIVCVTASMFVDLPHFTGYLLNGGRMIACLSKKILNTESAIPTIINFEAYPYTLAGS